ncbi:MAG: SDR family oxidoreductase [Rickettsiales bacterium]|nr:SDR family oxidoreductase [Rickettsiales bacterium]
MVKKLNGKIALITGGNSGIGLATAKKYAEEGATVIITGRNQETLDAAQAEIGANVHAVKCDVSHLGELDALFNEIRSKYSKIDILFANAGIAEFMPLEAVDETFYDRHFDINVKGLFFTVQKALPLLNDEASIILNASIVSTKGFGNFSVYAATKAAVRSFARSWATDLAPRKIRVNAISPGPIETPIYSKLGLSDEQMEEMSSAMATQVPLARFGQADEIASAALFLASNDSTYINGVELPVDGGMAQV